MPKTFSQHLQTTGFMLVITSSGMNVTMIAGFLVALFTGFFSRKFAITLSLLLLDLIVYAIFSGLQP